MVRLLVRGPRRVPLAPSHFKFRDAEGRPSNGRRAWPKRAFAAHADRTARIRRASRHARTAVVKATMPAPSAFISSGSARRSTPPPTPTFRLLRRPGRGLSRRAAGARPGRLPLRELDEVPSPCCAPRRVPPGRGAGQRSHGLLDTSSGCCTGSSPTAGRHDLRHAPVPRQLPGTLDGGGRLRAGGGEAVHATPVDVFFLEYDSERAGDFQPLQLVLRVNAPCSASSRPRPRNWKTRTAYCGARGGIPRPPPGPARPVDPMRLCQCGRRQCAERGRAMGQARADRGDRRARLGQPVRCRRPGIWHTRPLRAACKAKETTALGAAAAPALRSFNHWIRADHREE